MDGSVWTQGFGAARSSSDGDRPVSLAVQEGSAHLDRIPMLIRGLRHAGLCVMYQDRTLAVRMVENPFESWPAAATILAMGDRAIFDPDTAAEVIAAKRRVLASGVPERLEAGVRGRTDNCWYALNIEPDLGGSGMVRGLFVTASDITEIKRREETLKSLLSEVSHRSRNLLAIVQSILAHTARLESDPADFAAKFRGRIHSLALTQDIVTQANWRGAAFRHLVAAQLEPLTSAAVRDITVTGRDAQLAPTAALHVGLAIHELATNSATYGVLRHGRGTVKITMADAGSGLRFAWDERHDAPGAAPGRARFGSVVLSRALPQAVLGTARLDVDETGVRYALDLPGSALG
jgi:two-component sensor histidine kinase